MELLASNVYQGIYRVKYQGVEFVVIRTESEDGRIYYEPTRGWADISAETNENPESLAEKIDLFIYSVDTSHGI